MVWDLNKAKNVETDLKSFKKESLKKAKEQFETERIDNEVKIAKELLYSATNEVERLESLIVELQEAKKEPQKVMKAFNN